MVERWGTCARSYYSLDIFFFASSLSAKITQSISKKMLWMNELTSTSTLESEVGWSFSNLQLTNLKNRDRFADRINSLTEKLKSTSGRLNVTMPSRLLGVLSSEGPGKASEDSAISKVTKSSAELTLEQTQAQMKQIVKYLLFCTSSAEVEQESP